MTAPAPKSREEWENRLKDYALNEIACALKTPTFLHDRYIKETKQSLDALLDSIMSLQSEVERVTELEKQIDRLANFIMAEIPGEPSQSEGAIDTAIRLLKARQPKWAERMSQRLSRFGFLMQCGK